MDRILATHTGSLIRPPELLAFLAAKERGQDYDEEAYQKCLRESVDDVVRRQVEAGIDVVDDGEMGKASWITYLYERVERPRGAPYPDRRRQHAIRPAAIVRRSRAPTPRSTRSTKRRSARATPPRPVRCPDEEAAASGAGVAWVCTGPLTYDRAALDRDIANFKSALSGHDGSSTASSRWWRPPAPTGSRTSTTPARRSSYSRWPTRSTRSTRAIVDSGLLLQVDDAVMMHEADTMMSRGRVVGRLPALGRPARPCAQPRAARPPRGPRPLSRVLGQLARAACVRSPAEGRGRPDPGGERRLLRDGAGQRPARA